LASEAADAEACSQVQAMQGQLQAAWRGAAAEQVAAGREAAALQGRLAAASESASLREHLAAARLELSEQAAASAASLAAAQ
jgi:hypothetical protein